MDIAEEMVKVHLKHNLRKLGANDRTQAVAIDVRRGLLIFRWDGVRLL